VAAGALGFVATDISNSGIPAGAIVVMNVSPSANQNAGIRKIGSSTDTKRAVANGIPTYCGNAVTNSLQQVELYRAAADNVYHLVGWFY
jgi:hypothetical protein